jgi:hypothetical protein
MPELDKGGSDFSAGGGADPHVEVKRRCTGVAGVDEDVGVYIARDGREEVLDETGDGSMSFEVSVQLEVETSAALNRFVRDGVDEYD